MKQGFRGTEVQTSGLDSAEPRQQEESPLEGNDTRGHKKQNQAETRPQLPGSQGSRMMWEFILFTLWTAGPDSLVQSNFLSTLVPRWKKPLPAF